MKYISLAVILALLIWTWRLATLDRSFTLEQHKRVEAGVEQDVIGFIKQKYPQTTDISCPQLYTEVVKPSVRPADQPPDELIAHFRCETSGPVNDASPGVDASPSAAAPNAATEHADNDVADQVFEGFLRLKSNDAFATWSVASGEIRSPELSFRNGVHITKQSGK